MERDARTVKGCDRCDEMEKRVADLEEKVARYLRAIHREAEQWDRRAPNTAKKNHETYGAGPITNVN